MKYILLFFAAFFLLRVVLRFVLPVFRITTMANDQMRRMQDQMKEMERKVNQQQQPPKQGRAQRNGDYIDYEEVK